MAFVVCPRCGVKVRTANRLPAGRRITCDACRRPFTTGAADHDIPDAEILDDEPDDERNSERRLRRGQRRDDRSSRVAKPPARRSIPPVLLVAIGMGAFALLLGGAVLIYSLTRDSSKPGGSDLLAYAPIDAVILSGYDLDELGRNEGFRKALERRAPPDLVELDRAGLRSSDLSRVLVARTANNGNTCAVRFKKAPDQSKYLQPVQAGNAYATSRSIAGNYKFGYFADDKTLVLADKEPAIQALREKGRPQIPADLRLMVGKVRGPVWRASGRLSAAQHNRIGMGDDGYSLRIGPSAGTAAWLVPDGRMADVRFEVEFDNAAQAKQAVATLKGVFLLQRSTNELGQLNVREGTDPGDVIDIRRGYENADVSDDRTRVSVKLQLPAGEAIRAVGSVRY
jgi:hypothetical protein